MSPACMATAAPEEIHRFEREIQAQARLQHPHIASLFSAVRREDVFALLMEWVDGETLERRLAGEPLPLDTAVALAAQVLDAVGGVILELGPGSGVLAADLYGELKALGKAPEMTARVDPSILGGLKVKVGSKLFDASLKTKLDQMKFALKRA